ncbi:UNVERIFIED_CONTAM: hypothetical protein FKN15_077774 [Acipenser sinensis]
MALISIPGLPPLCSIGLRLPLLASCPLADCPKRVLLLRFLCHYQDSLPGGVPLFTLLSQPRSQGIVGSTCMLEEYWTL